MANKTPNLGLNVTPVSDTEKRFMDFRTEVAGDQPDSNMSIIDKKFGESKDLQDNHIQNEDVHVRTSDKSNWNQKADSSLKINGYQLNKDINLKPKDIGSPSSSDFDDVESTANSALSIAEQNRLSTTIYTESSSSSTIRTITIPNINSLDDIYNMPINIRANAYGTESACTLNINGYGAYYIKFPHLDYATLVNSPPIGYWTRIGEVYTVYWDDNSFVCTNFSIRSASTAYEGLTILSNSTTSTDTTMAATPRAVKAVNDKLQLTTVDPGEGTSSSYPNGTWVGFYEA